MGALIRGVDGNRFYSTYVLSMATNWIAQWLYSHIVAIESTLILQSTSLLGRNPPILHGNELELGMGTSNHGKVGQYGEN